MNKTLLSAALAGILAASMSMSASAADATAAAKEKCYGIAKAGKNDCKSAAAGGHSCAGQATKDSDASDWKFVASAADCAKAGGSSTAPAAK